MENEVLIKVEGASKKFCKDLKTGLKYGLQDLFLNVLRKGDSSKLRPKEFWAVKDVNFELRRGECLGLIGHNGAGKSTLLKMLNGLIRPDEGSITMHGRVGALIELGAGFNPILTGRENIYNNGAVLGFTKEEINSKFDQIVAFAELEEFIDMPVQHYSSGMKVRLGFSVAAQMEPDILIIDEVLAVGDIGFRAKCLNKIGEILPRCTTIIVSHSMPQLARTCNRVIMLDAGGLVIDTRKISDAIDCYYNAVGDLTGDKIISGTMDVTMSDFKINNQDSNREVLIPFNSSLVLKINLQVKESVSRYFISYAFIDSETKIVANVFSFVEEITFNKKGQVDILTKVQNLNLGAGNYVISVSINEVLPSNNRGKIYYHNTSIGSVKITGVTTAVGPIQFLADWNETKVDGDENIE